jgi:hypothetical protein
MADKKDLPDLHPGQVRITCGDPELVLAGWLGPDSPKFTGGIGGWIVTPRPRQIGMVTYEGVEPLELSFQMILDNILVPFGKDTKKKYRRRPRADFHSLEPDLRDLMDVLRGDGESDPGIVRVEGIPSQIVGKRWVIRNVEFGDAIRRKTDMHRIRLQLDFTLLEYRPPHFERVRKKSVGRNKGKTEIIHAKANDTPATIAKRRKCKWTDIRTLNQGIVRRANQDLKKGQKIRVPVAKSTHKGR